MNSKTVEPYQWFRQ